MIIIGEKINSTRKAIAQAIADGDAHSLRALAEAQAAAGAHYIDVNAGTFVGDETERLTWLVRTVQQEQPLALCIDTPNPAAMDAALAENKNPDVLINSITLEKARWDAILPLAVAHKARVIALTMDDSGMPDTAEQRLEIAARMIEGLTGAGIAIDDILIDPLVRPVSTDTLHARRTLDAIRLIRARFPEVHFACGASNVSYGLPARRHINHAFLIAAMCAGLDGAIIDPLDSQLMSLIAAMQTILGQDEYCMSYISQFREGKIT